MKKHKQRWIKKVYRLLCKYQGAPENENEEKNIRDWAAAHATEESSYFNEGLTPKEAVEEEFACS